MSEPVADRFTDEMIQDLLDTGQAWTVAEVHGEDIVALAREARRARTREAELEVENAILRAAGQALFAATEAFESYLCDNGDRQNAYNTSTNAQEAWLAALEAA